MATLDRDDIDILIDRISDAVVNKLRGINSAPNINMIHAMAGNDIEAMMDAREKEIRAKRRGKR